GQLPTVAADAAQIEQVIMNLCINARDAMPDGGKLIVETDVALLNEEYVKTHLGAKPGSYVVLAVTDTGTGMNKETIEKVFEPFFTTKDEGKGTGLGLAMVYGVVKNHGGSVQVYSELGEGSTFKVYLPVGGKPEVKEVSRYEAPHSGSELILVVDDEESILFLTRDVLETHGYTALLAEGGEEAVEIYKKHNANIDLVILDMVMPKMGGLETFLQLKKLNPKVKAILSTGYSQNGKAQEILDNGARGFLQKPYQVNALLSKVRSVLDARI
ncbi:MAG: response regulator, partial [Candidatus Hydrogenedentota bacterium]